MIFIFHRHSLYTDDKRRNSERHCIIGWGGVQGKCLNPCFDIFVLKKSLTVLESYLAFIDHIFGVLSVYIVIKELSCGV